MKSTKNKILFDILISQVHFGISQEFTHPLAIEKSHNFSTTLIFHFAGLNPMYSVIVTDKNIIKLGNDQAWLEQERKKSLTGLQRDVKVCFSTYFFPPFL